MEKKYHIKMFLDGSNNIEFYVYKEEGYSASKFIKDYAMGTEGFLCVSNIAAVRKTMIKLIQVGESE